ncbi:MAG: hypothetical protein IIC94_03040 [Chloroflexi bacterium]|nr:hypothetical protein [Chloroflexota bacterium]
MCESVFQHMDDHAVFEVCLPEELGGLLYVQDHREIPMCLMWCRKG